MRLKNQPHRGAATRPALNLESTTVSGHDPLRQRQPKTCPARASRGEWLGHPRQMLRSNAASVVPDAEDSVAVP